MTSNCLSLQYLGYGAFSQKIHDIASQQRIPINASIELTMRCNLRCQHCYLPPNQRTQKKADELSLSEFQRIFSELADAGCLWMMLTGGEPLLRPDFLNLYDMAKQKGFIVSLFTNGTLLNESIIDHLAEWRPFSIEISLYGATEKTYENITGVPGSFKRCMRGIELCLDRGLPLKLKTVLMTLNEHELQKMKDFSKSLGIDFRFDPVITSATDGSSYPSQFRLPIERIVQIEKEDEERSEAWPKEMEDLLSMNINVPNMYTCSAGRCSLHVDSFGRMSLCLSAREPSYDLRNGSFREGWEEFVPKILALEYPAGYECLSCPLRTVCAQCPAMGITELGDPLQIVPFLCQLSKLRHKAFDK